MSARFSPDDNATMEPPLLQIENARKSFGAVEALRGVSFDLRRGEVHALLGENGAGKSTLIKLITGAHAPDGGTLSLSGQSFEALNPALARELGISCIYQQPALFPDLTVMENLRLRMQQPSPWRRIDSAEMRGNAVMLLERIGANIRPEAEVRRLTMPEQQLVEIACAIGLGAKVVIMDEPTASLGRMDQERLYGVIRELRSSGVGVIYISHRLEEIFALADRVTVLRDGQSVGTHSVSEIQESELIAMMIGRSLTQLYPPKGSLRGEVVLSLQELGCLRANVPPNTLELRAGEICGLAGLVGAGRSELARTLFGLTPADVGTLHLRGRQVRVNSPQDAVSLGIAYVPEDRRRHGVVPELSITHNVTAAILRTLFPKRWIRPQVEQELANDFVGRLAIKCDSIETPVAKLSGGNQQKVALARWLATRPSVLILDEPTQGVDIGAKGEIHRIIRQLADQGSAVLLISSDLPEILGMSDRIAVMRGGALVATLPGDASGHEVMAHALGRGSMESKERQTP